jgi:hypothetical protein
VWAAHPELDEIVDSDNVRESLVPVRSVFTGPGVSLFELARSCRNNQVRRTTVGAVLSAGGPLRLSAGPPYHCDLYGLTPQQFDAILSVPEPNPVPKPDLWQPS